MRVGMDHSTQGRGNGVRLSERPFFEHGLADKMFSGADRASYIQFFPRRGRGFHFSCSLVILFVAEQVIPVHCVCMGHLKWLTISCLDPY